MYENFDAAWHVRALSGEAAAVDQLATAALDPLYQFCFYRVGGDRHLCEEVVQETLVRAIGGLAAYEPGRAGGRIFPWLTGLARNEIRRVLSMRNNTASLEMLWARMDDDLRRIFAELDSRPLEEETLRREETREMVSAAMSQLPPPYRDALEAKYVLGRSVREMARLAGGTEKSIESKLSRARDAFRQTFRALVRNLNAEEYPVGSYLS